jgi:hypothetical protein
MIALHDIRATIRAMVAADEMGTLDGNARRTILLNVVKDLQEIEIWLGAEMEYARTGTVRLPGADIQRRGGDAEPHQVPGQDQPRQATGHVVAVETSRTARGEEVRYLTCDVGTGGLGSRPEVDHDGGSARDRGGKPDHGGSEREQAQARVQSGLVLGTAAEGLQGSAGGYAGADGASQDGGQGPAADGQREGEGSEPMTKTDTFTMIDVREPEDVEVRFSEDGSVMWVNVDEMCRLRVTGVAVVKARIMLKEALNERK